ncbi:MAG: ComF family protein [Pseudomonadota bacterium]
MSNFTAPFLNIWSKIAQSFPQDCLLCGAACGNTRLCAACRASLPHHTASCCPRCALPTPDGHICGQCLKQPPAFDRTLAAFSYAFPADALVQALKYRHNLAAASVLAEPLAELARAQPRPDLLVPMPLHSSRLRERGFNQSIELTRIVAKTLDLPLAPDACERTRATAPQVSLPIDERAKNLRGAFAGRMDLTGKKVAILDDVMTTGATLNELARTLRRAGAAEISAWVVARA